MPFPVCLAHSLAPESWDGARAGSGSRAGIQDNLALTVLGYFTLLPVVMSCSLACERWMERDLRNLAIAVVLMLIGHLWLRRINNDHQRIGSEQPSLDDDDEQFVTTLHLSR
jgi:hypothetical protein